MGTGGLAALRQAQGRQRRAAAGRQPFAGGFDVLLAQPLQRGVGIGRRQGRRRQRDTRVGNSRSGASATSRNTVCGGGSSSTLSSALAETTFSAWAGYSSATRQPPRWVAVLNQDSNARIWSMRISLDGARLDALPATGSASSACSAASAPSSTAMASGRMRRRSGWLPLANQAQAAQWPQARPSCGVSQSRLAAAATAKSSLPMPARPCTSHAWAKRSRLPSQLRAVSSCQGRNCGALTGLASCSRNRCQFSCGHLRMDEAHHARPSIKASRPASSSARISEMERVESIRRIRSGSALARSW